MSWTTGRRGPTRRSRADRARILHRDPVCRCSGCPACTAHGCTRPSTEDDHVVPVAEGGSDYLSNRRGICSPCHAVKSRAEAARGAARRSARRTPPPHPGLL